VQLSTSTQAVTLPLYDFAEYWAAGRLIAHGQNPYDSDSIARLERDVGRDGDPLPMLNPPWTLPFVLPFGMLPGHLAHLLWISFNFVIVLVASDLLWHEYGGPRASRGIAWLLAFTFVPTFLTLYLGQIAAFMLGGVALFLRCERRGEYVRAGAATLLLAVKPHLFILFWLAFGWQAFDRRGFRMASGAFLALMAGTLLAMAFNPAVLEQYRQMLVDTPPSGYRTPTIGTVLRLLFGEEHFAWQFVAPLAGVVWFLPVWIRRDRSSGWKEQMPMLLFVSLLTAPYGSWPFDLIVLLLPVIQIAATAMKNGASIRGAAIAYAAANATAAIFIVAKIDFFWWIWLTPALLLSYLTGLQSLRRIREMPALSSHRQFAH
jgi:hypothetical protein